MSDTQKQIDELKGDCDHFVRRIKELCAENLQLERERDAYKNKLLFYESALIEIRKLSNDDCPDFALDSIQSLTHKMLND